MSKELNDLQVSDLDFNILDCLRLLSKNKNFQKKNSLIFKTFKRIIFLKLINSDKNKNISLEKTEKLIYKFLKNKKNYNIFNKSLNFSKKK